jgi:hypothetical protein
MLNFTPPNFQILVGNLDVTSAIVSISIKRNNWSIGKPLFWSGNIELAELDIPYNLPESLDDWINKTRWARGNLVRLYVKTNLICSLRIASYFYNEDERKATLEVSQLLDLLDFESLPKDYEGLGFKPDKPISLIDLTTRLLNLSGITNFAFNITGIFNADIVPPNHTGGSLISLASKYLNERLIWLYHNPDESVRVVKFPLLTGSLLFTRAISEIEDYLRSQVRELPNNIIAVTGGGAKFDPCEIDTNPVEELGFGTDINIVTGVSGGELGTSTRLTYKKVTTVVQRTDKLIVTEIKIFRRRGSILPNGTVPKWIKNLDKLILTEQTINRQFFDDQGRLFKEITSTDAMRAIVFPDNILFYGNERIIKNAYVEEVIYDWKIPTKKTSNTQSVKDKSGVVRYKTNTKKSPFLNSRVELLPDDFNILDTPPPSKCVPVVSSDIESLVIETWQETDKNKECPKFKYEKKTFRRKQNKILNQNFLNTGTDRMTYSLGGLIQDTENSKTSVNSTPPNWELLPPLYPVTSANLNVEIAVDTPGVETPTIENQRRLEYQSSTLTSDTEAKTLAEFLGKMQWYQYYSREISIPLLDSDEFIQNPNPLARTYIHKGCFVLSGESINIVQNEAELAFTGLFQRALGFAVPTREQLAIPAPPPTIENPDPQPPYPLPEETSTFSDRLTEFLPVALTFSLFTEFLGQFSLPSLLDLVIENDTIEVINGNVVTIGAYLFTEIITSNNNVVVSTDGNVVTKSDTPFPDLFNEILAMDGEVLTMDGQLLLTN